MNKIHYKKAHEYTDHFLELFEKAVTRRLRSHTQASAHLSGGLDSSCVVGMANIICKKQNNPPPKVYSMVFTGLAFDEQQYVQSLAELHGIHVYNVESQYISNIDWHQQSTHSLEPPDMPNLSMFNRVTNNISVNSSRVLLSGTGGDELFSGSGYPYLDLFYDRKFSKILVQLKHSVGVSLLFALKQWGLNSLWPFMPEYLKGMLCKRRISLPTWLPSDFIHRTNLLERIRHNDIRPTLDNLSTLSLQNLFSNGSEVFFLETMDRYYASHQIEYRSPFLDRTLMEFAFGIPEYERQLAGNNKILLRRQNNRLLPTSIRKRYDKAEFSYFYGKTFSSPKFHSVLKNMSIAQNGWVNSLKFEKKLPSFIFGL